MTRVYRAAVVGCGRIGVTMEEDPRRVRPATHAGAYRGSLDTELSAVVDVDPTRLGHARRLFPEAQGFTSVDTMLDAVEPDIVSVATPPDQHRPVVEACAARGVRAVICEKPIAPSAEDGRAVVRSCAAAGTLLLINHSRRFDPVLGRLRDEILAGGLGDVMQATAYYTAGLFNSASHMVDLMRFFLGDVTWVMAAANAAMSHPADDLSLDALLGFASGARAALQVQEVKDYAIFTLRLHGRAGAVAIDRFGFEVERTAVRACVEWSGYKELDPTAVRRHGQARSFMAPMVAHVVACLEGRAEPISGGEDGLAALEVLLAMAGSADADGRRIELRS
jgi:predicted dehydrogenase